MASSSDIIQKVVDEVLGYIKARDPDCHQKLQADGSKKDDLIAQIRQVARDEISQSEQLKRAEGDISKITLPPGRLTAIQNGLQMATYRIKITDKTAELTFVDGTHFKTIQLDSKENTSYAYYMELASIIIEGIMLVMTIIGLKIPISNQLINKVSDKVVEELEQSSAFQKAVENFIESWDDASGGLDKAKALFHLLKDTYSLGILWSTIKLLCSEMTWWDWTKAAALIAAQLVAAFATDGVALIAKIALALKSAYDFGDKIVNLKKLT
jgi:hypothetical protein